jgi:uncharacterized protein (TIGR02391 family)
MVVESLDPKLREVVEQRLNSRQYTDAIKSAFLLLTNVLREKSGSTNDGERLVGNALGGTNPIVKLNELQTESEKNFQEGITAITRGLYLAYRNPRNHDLHEDDEETADRVILMIDTVIKVLAKTESFDVEAFVDQKIFDRYFVINQEYVVELINQIPPNHRLTVFKRVLGRIKEGNSNNIQFFVTNLYSLLNPTEIDAVIGLLSEQLENSPENELPSYLMLVRDGMWTNIAKLIKLRIEKMIIESLKRGTRDGHSSSYGSAGILGTYAFPLGKDFEDKNALYEAVHDRLMDSWDTQNYLADYVSLFPIVFHDEKQVESLISAILYATMSNKAYLLRNSLLETLHQFPESWKQLFKANIEERVYLDRTYATELLKQINASPF